MLQLFLVLAGLLGLPALAQVTRVLVALFVRIIALAFVMALAMIVLLALVTHGRMI